MNDLYRFWFFVSLAAACVLVPSFVHPVCMAVDTVVVRPSAWGDALHTWRAYRQAQGHQIAEINCELGRTAIADQILQLAQQHPRTLKFVLLAGDVSAESTSVPTFYHDSTAMTQFGGDARIASDNDFGDLDGDFIPELAVGRIPADSAEQLQQVLQRTIAFESSQDFSTWRRDVHVVAGVGGFGAVADSVIELTTRRFLADRIPKWSQLSMTHASLKSQYCPDPWRFSEACIDRMNQGGMFWVYIGHGHLKTLDFIRAADEWLPILTEEHVPTVRVGQRSPIAVFLACYTGAFDAIEDSLAEKLVLSETGPIAALAASRVSGPYGLAMLSDGLLSNVFEKRLQTLGEVVLKAKQDLLASPKEVPLRPDSAEMQDDQARVSQLQMIAAIASALSPQGYDLEAERREHVWEMNLLGDPLLRLCYPQPLGMQCPDPVAPGQALSLRGAALAPGRLTIELAYRREQVRKDLVAISGELTSREGRDELHERYQHANQRVLVKVEKAISENNFEVMLTIPYDLARGKYVIRGFLESANGWQVASCDISVREP